MIQVFGGIAIAAAVFAATLWSLVQAVRQSGYLRKAHAAAIVATLLAMTALSLQSPGLSQITGLFLALAAATALWLESRWNRVLPLFQLLFAAALLAALPFAG